MFNFALYSVEQSGDDFIVYFHGNGCGRSPHSVFTARTPEMCARFLRALVME